MRVILHGCHALLAIIIITQHCLCLGHDKGVEPGRIDHDHVCARYKERHFLPQNQSEGRVPPLLWSFPGSGNTWVRLVLEHASSILTGSIYHEMEMVKLLPGEMTCNASSLVIKAHPR